MTLRQILDEKVIQDDTILDINLGYIGTLKVHLNITGKALLQNLDYILDRKIQTMYALEKDVIYILLNVPITPEGQQLIVALQEAAELEKLEETDPALEQFMR